MYNFCEIILKKHVWPAIICFYLRLGLIYIYLPHFFSLPHFLFVLSSSSLSKEKIRMKLISSRYVIIIYYLYKYIRSLSSRIYRFIPPPPPNMKLHKSFGIANGLSECSIYIRNWIFGKNFRPLKFQ